MGLWSLRGVAGWCILTASVLRFTLGGVPRGGVFCTLIFGLGLGDVKLIAGDEVTRRLE